MFNICQRMLAGAIFFGSVGLSAQPLAQPLQSLQISELPRPPKGRAADQVNQSQAWQALLKPALTGQDIGLISEAGLPAVADPGALLVAAAHDADIEVIPLSGPSALLMALAASGLNGQSFAFVGYLPVDGPARNSRIRELEALSVRQQQTQLMIETPYRNSALLQGLLTALRPQTRLSISCGLTLPQGWTRSASVEQWRSSGEGMPNNIPAVFAILGGGQAPNAGRFGTVFPALRCAAWRATGN